MEFTEREALVLNRVQRGIPGVSEPFKAIAEEVGLTEDEVLETVLHLKEKNVIRNISGIFEGKKLGYFLSLVAFEVPDERADAAAAIINSHPGVSHNYLRNHRFNIWFTLAEESEEEFHKTVSFLAAKTDASDFLVMRNEKLLKIGVFLNIGESEENSDAASPRRAEFLSPAELDDTAKEAILLLQNDLPIEKYPFKKIAESGKYIHGEKQLLLYFTDFTASGIMRRYAAVLKHRSAGYTANSMTAWKIDGSADMELFMNEKAISHLYFRTVYPGRWEHPLFAMIHAKSDDELKDILNRLSEMSGIKDYLSLSSMKEYKKTRVRYFSEEFKEWKRLNHD
ncbi:MAG: Lrp/AsnC family transcriptional regulator [Spirochaetae bacterium HGW-Spirochaetae-5]|nr:MAG: Lrp/AsnC family transcriptional regulator [Spirochaetae bacterium HGW-Spirochaetae-5]